MAKDILNKKAAKDYVKKSVRAKPKEKNNKCKYCGFKTAWLSALKLHIKSKHSGDQYVCGHCNMTFTLKSNAKRHSRNVHPNLVNLIVEVESNVNNDEVDNNDGQQAQEAGEGGANCSIGQVIEEVIGLEEEFFTNAEQQPQGAEQGEVNYSFGQVIEEVIGLENEFLTDNSAENSERLNCGHCTVHTLQIM